MTFEKIENVESKNEQQLVAIKDQGERQLEAISSYGATSKSQKIEFNNEKNKKQKKKNS